MKRHIFILLIYAASAVFYARLSVAEDNLEDELSKGKLYLETGLYSQAIEYFNGLASKYSDIPEIYYYLGAAYYAKGDHKEAEKCLKRAVELNPDYAEAYYNLALMEYKKGDSKKVMEYLELVTSIDKNFQRAYYNKGVALLELDRPDFAASQFAYSLHLVPLDRASLLGLLESCARLGMIEITGSSEEEVRFSVHAPRLDETKKAQPPLNEGEMQIFITRLGFRQPVMLNVYEPLAVRGIGKEKELVEIDFGQPLNIRNKYIKIMIKGEKGGERIEAVMRDNKSRRSRPFYLSGIQAEWKTVSIDAEKEAANIDLNNVEYIRLEPAPKKGEEIKVLIKSIEISDR